MKNDNDNSTQRAPSAQGGMGCCNLSAKKSFLNWRNRRTLTIAAMATAVGTGMVFNWGWVTIGIAPLILSVLPCLVICALGLCAAKLFGGGATAKAEPDNVFPLRRKSRDLGEL